jgi:hypothetical protein
LSKYQKQEEKPIHLEVVRHYSQDAESAAHRNRKERGFSPLCVVCPFAGYGINDRIIPTKRASAIPAKLSVCARVSFPKPGTIAANTAILT